MHPEVTSDQPGRCPKCGMKLLASQLGSQPAAGHDAGAVDHGDMAMDHDAEAIPHDEGHDTHAAHGPPAASSGKTT